MLSTVALRDLGDLRAGFNAAVSGAQARGGRGWAAHVDFLHAARPSNLATGATGNRMAGGAGVWRCPSQERGAPGLVLDATSHWGSGRTEDHGGGFLGGVGAGGIHQADLERSCLPPAPSLSLGEANRQPRLPLSGFPVSWGETERRAWARHSSATFKSVFPGWRYFWCLLEKPGLASL